MKLTQEEQETLAKAEEINKRVEAEREAEWQRKAYEKEAKRRREKEEVFENRRREPWFNLFIEAFKTQCPDIDLNATESDVTITLPNGNTIEIKADTTYDDDENPVIYYIIRIDGHEVCTNEYGNIRIPNE